MEEKPPKPLIIKQDTGYRTLQIVSFHLSAQQIQVGWAAVSPASVHIGNTAAGLLVEVVPKPSRGQVRVPMVYVGSEPRSKRQAEVIGQDRGEAR